MLTRDRLLAVGLAVMVAGITNVEVLGAQAERERKVVAEAWRSDPFPPVPAVVTGSKEVSSGVRVSWSDVAHKVGGALVGGWLGYVGAQVVQSDWDKETNAGFRGQRSLWSVAGALIGVAGSHAIGSTDPPLRLGNGVNPADRARRVIGEREIRESGALTAYELVSALRPEWLVERGTHSLSETARGVGAGREMRAVPGAPKLIVYLADIRLGGVDRLRGVETETLTSLRFLDAREATLRYGMGHTHGAILLSTAVPAP